MLEALQYCETLVREADKDRFLATLFAPAPLRGALYALYAFDIEISQVRDRISTPLPGEVRLQWWRDVLTAPSAETSAANPVATALYDTIERHALPRQAFIDLIDAHTFDLYDEPMATLGEFQAYAQATSATVIGLVAQILNDGEWNAREVIEHAGMAMALTAQLLHLSLRLSRGQCYLPVDMLAAHGVALADLYAGRITVELFAALAELRALATKHVDAVRAAAKDIPPRLLPALLPLALVPQTLRAMERANADPFQPQPLPQWRRQWILWRAARRPAHFLG